METHKGKGGEILDGPCASREGAVLKLGGVPKLLGSSLAGGPKGELWSLGKPGKVGT